MRRTFRESVVCLLFIHMYHVTNFINRKCSFLFCSFSCSWPKILFVICIVHVPYKNKSIRNLIFGFCQIVQIHFLPVLFSLKHFIFYFLDVLFRIWSSILCTHRYVSVVSLICVMWPCATICRIIEILFSIVRTKIIIIIWFIVSAPIIGITIKVVIIIYKIVRYNNFVVVGFCWYGFGLILVWLIIVWFIFCLVYIIW